MTLLTQELLKKKLTHWVLSSKVPSVLGFDESQSLDIKRELQALVDMGLVEREGERRGLKFRLKNESNPSSSDGNDDEQDNDDTDESQVEKAVPGKLSESASLRAFFADKTEIKDQTIGKTPLQLISVLTDFSIKDPSILSHTLSYKRTSEGTIIVSFYSGCIKQYEKIFTVSAFSKVWASELKALSKPIPASAN